MPSKSVQNINELSAALDKLKTQIIDTTQLASQMQKVLEMPIAQQTPKSSMAYTSNAVLRATDVSQNQSPITPNNIAGNGFVMESPSNSIQRDKVLQALSKERLAVSDLEMEYKKLEAIYQDALHAVPSTFSSGTVGSNLSSIPLLGRGTIPINSYYEQETRQPIVQKPTGSPYTNLLGNAPEGSNFIMESSANTYSRISAEVKDEVAYNQEKRAIQQEINTVNELVKLEDQLYTAIDRYLNDQARRVSPQYATETAGILGNSYGTTPYQGLMLGPGETQSLRDRLKSTYQSTQPQTNQTTVATTQEANSLLDAWQRANLVMEQTGQTSKSVTNSIEANLNKETLSIEELITSYNKLDKAKEMPLLLGPGQPGQVPTVYGQTTIVPGTNQAGMLTPPQSEVYYLNDLQIAQEKVGISAESAYKATEDYLQSLGLTAEQARAVTNALHDLKIEEESFTPTDATVTPQAGGLAAKVNIAKQDMLVGTGGTLASAGIVQPAQVNVARQQADAIAETKKRIEALDSLAVGGSLPIESAVKKFGFSLNDLKSVSTEASTGVTRSFFQIEEGGGVMRNLSVTTNKWGETLVDTQRRFRSFGDQIFSDIGKVAQWGVAVALIYTPMYKLGQLLNDAVTIESKLAEVTRAMTNSQQGVNEVFQASVEAANLAGESVTGVIDGYAEAYKATGSITDATQRFAVTNKFLADALALAKLSALDQATAIDVLSAALKQMGLPLDQGTKVLDQWLALSRIANVPVETLATSVAIVGDAADAAGVSIDDLNGMVAILSENLPYSATQIANSARAIISGFQSEGAIKELNNLGIATEDIATGTSKSVSDILAQLNKLRKQGVLSDEELSRISLIAGGGSRRQAAVSTLIENYNLVAERNGQIQNMTGLTESQLAAQTDTVQTAITRLGNAFSALAITMGTKGGILDMFQSLTNMLTSIVTGLGSVSGLLGTATPMLALVGGATAYMSSRGSIQRSAISQGASNLLSQGLFGGGTQNMGAPIVNEFGERTGRAQTAQAAGINTWMSGWGKENVFGSWSGAGRAALTGGLVGALPAISSISAGEFDKAGAEIGGSIVGSLVSKGSPIGGAIGLAIAEAFYNASIGYKAQWQNFFTEVNNPSASTNQKGSAIEQQRQVLEQQVFAQAGFGNEAIGKLLSNILSGAINVGTSFSGAHTTPTPEQTALGMNDLLSTLAGFVLGEGTNKNLFDKIFGGTGENQDLQKRIAELEWQGQATEGASGRYAQGMQQQFNTQNLDLITSTISNKQKEILNSLISGDMTTSAYGTAYKALEDLNVKASEVIPALGEDLSTLTQATGIKDTAGALQELADVIINVPADAVNTLNNLADAVYNAIIVGDPIKIKEAQQQLQEYFSTLVKTSRQANSDLIKELTVSNESITPDLLPQLEAQYQAEMQLLKQTYGEGMPGVPKGYGFKGEETPQVIEFSDGSKQLLTKYWPIWSDLLSKIVDNTSKLEGVYNLPSGADFFVPFQGYKAGDFGGSVDLNTQATVDNTDALKNATEQQFKQYEYANPPVFSGAHVAEGEERTTTGTAAVMAGAAKDFGTTVSDAVTTATTNFSSGVTTAGDTLVDKINEAFAWIESKLGITDIPNQTTTTTPNTGQYVPSTANKADLDAWLKTQNYNDMRTAQPTSYRVPTSGTFGNNSVINVQPVAKLSLTLETKTNLVLDGKQVASVVSKYLADSLTSKSRAVGSNVSLNII
jgi:TP901 family phage tail tape measure protein